MNDGDVVYVSKFFSFIFYWFVNDFINERCVFGVFFFLFSRYILEDKDRILF